MKLLCDCGSNNMDIMSIEEKDSKVVEINYICNDCGCIETDYRYLYKKEETQINDKSNKEIYPASKKQRYMLEQALEHNYINDIDYKKALKDSTVAYRVIGEAFAKKTLDDNVKLINTCVNTMKNYDGMIYDHNEVVNIGIWDNYELPIYCKDDM